MKRRVKESHWWGMKFPRWSVVNDNDNDNVYCINQSKTEIKIQLIIKCSQLHSLSILWEKLCNYLYSIAKPKQMYCIYVALTVAWLRRGPREAGKLISRDQHFQHNKDNYGKQSQYSSKNTIYFYLGSVLYTDSAITNANEHL